jgi:hypothetical protein
MTCIGAIGLVSSLLMRECTIESDEVGKQALVSPEDSDLNEK